MRKTLLFICLSCCISIQSQTDFSANWEDFFSYTNVKDFIKVDALIYAVSDNAIFTYNTQNQEIKKLSSVQGLSGETTSAIHYNKTFNRLVIGYENGLVEVVDENGTITVSADIVNFSQTGSKRINHIYEHENKLYLSTPFAIVVYDIERVEFGDTYFIGQNSSEIFVNQTTVSNNTIYAATNNGIFTADITNLNLIDFNLWQQHLSTDLFSKITVFNTKIYTVSGANLYVFENGNLSLIRGFFEEIKGLKSSTTNLSAALNTSAFIFDTSLNEIAQVNQTPDFNFNLNTLFSENNIVFLATTQFGILTTNMASLSSFTEIHPDGPISNSPFSIAVQNDNLWVVYGGYDDTFSPRNIREGYSHFINNEWKNVRFDPNFPITDLNHITINPNDDQHVYISSMGSTSDINSVATGGLLEIRNDEIVNFYNQNNSPLENILNNLANKVSIRISGTAYDNQGNLWITNVGFFNVENKLKKISVNREWKGVNINDIYNIPNNGLSEIAIDRNNTLWVGSRRNGAIVYNENGDRKKAFTTNPSQGSLPNLNVRTIATDNNNRVWFGTLNGLVVYNNGAEIFETDVFDAAPIIILDDGIPKKLLGDETINSIVIDGANNKWFGTDNAGVLNTNPNGQTTLANFNTANSPLPSNKIIKIAIDNSTGKVFFATNKGIVAYNSNVAPFGDQLGEVYAYPNPVLKNNETVTIDGRNGSHLPNGTNVKILDIAGYLVYETNVVEGQELQGGKVVWDKRNLAGNKVASGVYIVLLSNDDASETATTKIAIIN